MIWRISPLDVVPSRKWSLEANIAMLNSLVILSLLTFLLKDSPISGLTIKRLSFSIVKASSHPPLLCHF